MSEENRETTSIDYFGGGNNTGAEGTYTDRNYRDDFRTTPILKQQNRDRLFSMVF